MHMSTVREDVIHISPLTAGESHGTVSRWQARRAMLAHRGSFATFKSGALSSSVDRSEVRGSHVHLLFLSVCSIVGEPKFRIVDMNGGKV